jgi:hypothetical protein
MPTTGLAQCREQPLQAAAADTRAMARGDQGAQVMGGDFPPLGDVLAGEEAARLLQIAAVIAQRMRREPPFDVQVV